MTGGELCEEAVDRALDNIRHHGKNALKVRTSNLRVFRLNTWLADCRLTCGAHLPHFQRQQREAEGRGESDRAHFFQMKVNECHLLISKGQGRRGL